MPAERTPRGLGFVLVEILIVIAIIALVVVGYYGLSGESEGEEERPSTPKQAIDRGKMVECAANLRSLRAEIEMYQIENGRYPQKFNPSAAVGTCPVSGKPYVYEPQTGRIYCTTPGHEKL